MAIFYKIYARFSNHFDLIFTITNLMFLFPKRPKFTSSFSNKKVTNSLIKNPGVFRFSSIGLIADETGFITGYQLEAIRLFLRRRLSKKAQIFFKILPCQPITKKPNEIRLGRGKGKLKYWTLLVKRNQVIVELVGLKPKTLTLILSKVKDRLSLKTHVYNKNFRWIL